MSFLSDLLGLLFDLLKVILISLKVIFKVFWLVVIKRKGKLSDYKDQFREGYEDAENRRIWAELVEKNWGYKVVEGDLDGYPDIWILIVFVKPVGKDERQELESIFKDWYERGFGEGDNAGEFGGNMHFMGEPKFKDKYASFTFDLGTVGIEKSLNFLCDKLSVWSKGGIKRVVFGRDDRILDKLIAPAKV